MRIVGKRVKKRDIEKRERERARGGKWKEKEKNVVARRAREKKKGGIGRKKLSRRLDFLPDVRSSAAPWLLFLSSFFFFSTVCVLRTSERQTRNALYTVFWHCVSLRDLKKFIILIIHFIIVFLARAYKRNFSFKNSLYVYTQLNSSDRRNKEAVIKLKFSSERELQQKKKVAVPLFVRAKQIFFCVKKLKNGWKWNNEWSSGPTLLLASLNYTHSKNSRFLNTFLGGKKICYIFIINIFKKTFFFFKKLCQFFTQIKQQGILYSCGCTIYNIHISYFHCAQCAAQKGRCFAISYIY